MEQLKDIILDFRASAKDNDGGLLPFHLQVSAPDYDEGRGYFCEVRCPYLREAPFMIFGADEQQACELVTDFIDRMLEGRAILVDETGKTLAVPTVNWRK